MKDVAVKAGVGLKTVSRVVNREAGVSAELVKHVNAVISEIGFRPNGAARSLRQGTTATIGLVCEDLAEPFQSQVIRAAGEIVSQNGYLLMVAASNHEAKRERKVVEALCSRQLSGLIVVPIGSDHSHLRDEIQSGMPMVFVDRPPVGAVADTVLADNANGVRAAVRHLFAHGHSNIAFIGDEPSLFTQTERVEGFRLGLRDVGIGADDASIWMKSPEPSHIDDAFASLRRSNRKATAIITGNSLCTFAVLGWLKETNCSWPALIGFDDFMLADLLKPGVSVIAQDPTSIGRMAAELLLRRIEGDATPTQTIRLGTRIISRGSGEIPPSAAWLRE